MQEITIPENEIKKQVYRLWHKDNPDKCYIGATKDTLPRLKASKMHNYRKGKSNKDCKLSWALKGTENKDWQVELLFDCTVHWKAVEKACIELYDSYHNGYNSTPCGQATNTPRQKRIQKQAISRPVRSSDGRIFRSAQSASLFYGFGPTSVGQVARGERKQCHGLTFEYIDE